MLNREGVLSAMAGAIPDFIDLKDRAAVALALIHKGYRGAEIGDDLPLIIDMARALRNEHAGQSSRNQILDIAATAAQF
jgi:hypothetical protein